MNCGEHTVQEPNRLSMQTFALLRSIDDMAFRMRSARKFKHKSIVVSLEDIAVLEQATNFIRGFTRVDLPLNT
jgi:hypothetical protein